MVSAAVVDHWWDLRLFCRVKRLVRMPKDGFLCTDVTVLHVKPSIDFIFVLSVTWRCELVAFFLFVLVIAVVSISSNCEFLNMESWLKSWKKCVRWSVRGAGHIKTLP